MGIISDGQIENDSKSEETSEKTSEKVPKDNMRNHKNQKKPKDSKKNKNKNLKTISSDVTTKIFTNKIIKNKNKKPHSKEKPKLQLNPEIKTILFKNNNHRNAVSFDRKNKSPKKNSEKKRFVEKKNINYNKFSKGLKDDDVDIIYNDDDEDYEAYLREIKNKNNFSNSINNNKMQNKILKEKINNTKKKLINLRKKLNTEINTSSKNINVKNKASDDIIITNNDNDNSENKISNTILINNSNITISNTDRDYLRDKIIKKKHKNSDNVLDHFNINTNINNRYNNNNYYSNNTYIGQNFDSIEIDDIPKSDLKEKKIYKKHYENKTFTKYNGINHHFYYTEPDLNFPLIKPKKQYNNTNHLSLSQYDLISNKKPDENIINKMEELKEQIKSKINNKNFSPQTRTTYPVFDTNIINKDNSRIKKNETLDNKHIKKNIPSYRRSYSKVNNHHITTLNPVVESQERREKTVGKNYARSLFNSNTKRRKFKNFYNFSFKKRDKKNKLKNMSIQLNNDSNSNSPNNISSNIDSFSDTKRIKNKKLYDLISQNIISEEKNINNNNINIDDINNLDKILSVKYRDAIEIDMSSINLKESLIDKELTEEIIDNKIIINFSKLENISTSQILFDGIIYKVVDNFNNDDKKFKFMERYFQLKKNCFRYYNNIQLARYNQDKPLVQFDIRHIKNLKIIDKKIFEEYDLSGKKIQFCFAVFLKQNTDFFVFVSFNENFGNNVFRLMNLLKNYYEDKNNNIN